MQWKICVGTEGLHWNIDYTSVETGREKLRKSQLIRASQRIPALKKEDMERKLLENG